MWEYIRREELGATTLLFFSKGLMERNTMLESPVDDAMIQALIDQWEIEDAELTGNETE